MFYKIILVSSLIITQLARIFLLLMSRLNVIVQSSIAGVFSVTLVTFVFYVFMDRLLMLYKMTLLSSLIITQCAGIFPVFMSRLNVIVQSSITGVFSVTLEFYILVDTIYRGSSKTVPTWLFALLSASTHTNC